MLRKLKHLAIAHGVTPHLMALTMIAGVGRHIPVSDLLLFLGDLIIGLMETAWTALFLFFVPVPGEVAAFLSALLLALRTTVAANRMIFTSPKIEASILPWRGALIIWGFIGFLYISSSAAEAGYGILGDFIAQSRVAEIIFVLIIGIVFFYLFVGWIGPFSNHTASFYHGLYTLGLSFSEFGLVLCLDQAAMFIGLIGPRV